MYGIAKWDIRYKKIKAKDILQGLKVGDTVKLGIKERFDKEQIGMKELFMDY